MAVHRDRSPWVPGVAPQDLWSSELSSQLCPARVPCGSWAPSLGSIPAPSLSEHGPLPVTVTGITGPGVPDLKPRCAETHAGQMSPAAQQIRMALDNWHPDLHQICPICQRYRLCFSGVFVRSSDKIFNYLGLNQICVAQNTAAGWCPRRRSYWKLSGTKMGFDPFNMWALIFCFLQKPKRGKAITGSNGYQFCPGHICWKGNF